METPDTMKALVLGLLFTLLAPFAAFAQDATPMAAAIDSGAVAVTSGGQAYASYLAAPTGDGPHPAIVLIHSFNGLENGYKTMTDRLAEQGYVTLAVGWQTFEKQPTDAIVSQLVTDSIAFLKARPDVDPARIGLTGFCAGGRYTMLFLPQLGEFKAGVAWYGFPYRGDTTPASLIGQLTHPMLIIHGTQDQASKIADIYKYATELDAAGKYFEMNIYQGEPHGFMLANGELRTDATATGAFDQMVSFFNREMPAP